MRVHPILCLLLAALWTPAWSRRREADSPLTGEKRKPAHLPYRDPPAPVSNNRDRPPPPPPQDSFQQQQQPKQPFVRQDSVLGDPKQEQKIQLKAGQLLHRDRDSAVNAAPPAAPQGVGRGAGVGADTQGVGAAGAEQDQGIRAGHERQSQQQHMENLLKKRANEQHAAQELVFQQQEQLRQQAQQRARQQQDAIRQQMEQQNPSKQSPFQQPGIVLTNRNIPSDIVVNSRNGQLNADPNGDVQRMKVAAHDDSVNRDPLNNPPVKEEVKYAVPTRKPKSRPTVESLVQKDGGSVGGGGAVVGDHHQLTAGNAELSQNAGDRFSDKGADGGQKKHGQEKVPDAPNPTPTIRPSDNNRANPNSQDNIPKPDQNMQNNNDVQPANPGLSDEFRRGLIKKVEGGSQNNPVQDQYQQNVQLNAFPPEQPVRQTGGLRINWDWDDFSITYDNYGPAEMKVRRAPHATTGEPWPLPQYYTTKKYILSVDPNFEFVVTANRTCDIIQQAIQRYRTRIVEDALEEMYDNLQNAEGTPFDEPSAKYKTSLYTQAPIIAKVSLKIRKPCTKFPSLQSDESYDLVLKKSSAYLWANEVWGLLRGLETFSQLVWKGPDGKLYVKETVISDYPRFPHRGILLDSSRHFIFKEVIFDMMDAMEMNKMNVLHWHIVDDQSFPYQSEVFPDLSAKGAYHPTFVYSLKDVREILEYGRMRGIRIMPEFDTPGHTHSWGLSRPELLTQCYSGSTPVNGYFGPIDPSRNSSYKFLKTFFDEVLHVFKDDFMHLGGDEVPLGCWQSNPDVVKFGDKLSAQSGQGAGDGYQSYFGAASPGIRLVYEHYVNRLMSDIKDIGKKRENGIKFIMWQEVMNNDLKLPSDTLIQVWMGDMADVSRAISLGYNVLYSTCWYLDHVEYGVKWPKYYQCDPVDNSYGYSIDEKKVKGGEACLWSEYIDNENLVQVTWPRASAVAERLWSSKDTRDINSAGERLSEHRCRMLRRGLSVGQVSGPDYCQKRGVSSRRRNANAQQEHVDLQLSVRAEQQDSKAHDCSWLMQAGGNVTVLAIVAVIALFLLVSLTRSHGKLYQLRQCRHRTILIVFLGVLLIYFFCYTTIWMHAFEFSGAVGKRKSV